MTALMFTFPGSPGAAKILPNWPTTDINIATRSGPFFLGGVRQKLSTYPESTSHPGNPEKIQHRFLLQQWHAIEGMLMERGAIE